MPIAVSWLVENQVMLVEITGYVTIQDSARTGRRVTELVEAAPGPVFLIQDLLNMGKTDFSWAAMIDSARALTHPKIRQVINIRKRQHSVVNAGIRFFNQALGLTTEDVETWVDALTYLLEQEPGLSDSLPSAGGPR